MTTLQKLSFDTLLSSEVSIPIGQSQIFLNVSPTETLLLEFGRNQTDAVIRLSKHISGVEVEPQQVVDPQQEVEPYQEEEELEEYPIPTPEYHGLPATIPPVHIKQEPNPEPQIRNGRRYNYVIRNRDVDLRNAINMAEFGKFVKRSAGKIVLDAIASVGNHASTIHEMLDTSAGSPVARAFRGRIRDLNKYVAHSPSAVLHEDGSGTYCNHRGRHLICEHGRSTNTIYWVDQRLATELFNF